MVKAGDRHLTDTSFWKPVFENDINTFGINLILVASNYDIV